MVENELDIILASHSSSILVNMELGELKFNLLLLFSNWLNGETGIQSLSPMYWCVFSGESYFSIGAPTRLPHSVHEPS